MDLQPQKEKRTAGIEPKKGPNRRDSTRQQQRQHHARRKSPHDSRPLALSAGRPPALWRDSLSPGNRLVMVGQAIIHHQGPMVPITTHSSRRPFTPITSV